MDGGNGLGRDDQGRVTITMQRRLQWMDTDAAERWHHTTFWRFAEEAEAVLHRDLGIERFTFGSTPRVHVEADFLAPIYFDDLLDVTITVAALGTTSVIYDIVVAREDTHCARGQLVTVLTDGPHGGKIPWPDDIAAALRPAEVPTG